MNKQRKNIIENNEVSDIKTYKLGGYQQKVLLDGKSKNSPILLCLHGGPGMPIPFSVGSRGMFPQFTDRFIMVYWDQLGCGINNYIIDNSFSINMFTDMTVDLIEHLKQEFPNNQLMVLGTSWGSVLAAKAVARVPELVDNVLTCGQIINDLFFNNEVYETLWKVDLSRKAKKRLSDLQEKKIHTSDDIKVMSALISKYTEGYQAKTSEKMPMDKFIKGFLSSPDYSFKDFIAIVKNGCMKNTSLYDELMQIDLTKVLQEMELKINKKNRLFNYI